MQARKAAILFCVIALVSGGAAYAAVSVSLNQVFQELEQQYGLPQGTLAKIAHVESGGNPTAGSPNRAYGMFQWFAQYWQPVARQVYGTYIDPSQRANPSVAAKVTAFSLAQAKAYNGAIIQQAKLDMILGLYLNHFLGQNGSRRFMQEYMRDPNGDAIAKFPREAANNASVFRPRTFAGVINEIARRLQVAGSSISTPGNFADPKSGISYAYNNADLPAGAYSSNPYPVSPSNEYRTYPDTYPPPSAPPLSQPQQPAQQLSSLLSSLQSLGQTQTPSSSVLSPYGSPIQPFSDLPMPQESIDRKPGSTSTTTIQDLFNAIIEKKPTTSPTSTASVTGAIKSSVVQYQSDAPQEQQTEGSELVSPPATFVSADLSTQPPEREENSFANWLFMMLQKVASSLRQLLQNL
jgi:hypothetical protein